MISLMLYAVAVISLVCRILGWCIWHAYLAYTRIFKAHNPKPPV
jgi:hypothetical protein